jgi:hypothetical protein
MKRKSEYTASEWAQLFPEERYAIQQADNDDALGHNVMPVRAADGRSTVYVDRVTGAPIASSPTRRIGELV